MFHPPSANHFSLPQGGNLKWCSRTFRMCMGNILLALLLGHLIDSHPRASSHYLSCSWGDRRLQWRSGEALRQNASVPSSVIR